MPHIRFRAIDISILRSFSGNLASRIRDVMKCPLEDVTIEHISSTYVSAFDPAPFVEVLWFNRGQEVQDSAALVITEVVRQEFQNPEQPVTVVFTALDRSGYYDNGVHY